MQLSIIHGCNKLLDLLGDSLSLNTLLETARPTGKPRLEGHHQNANSHVKLEWFRLRYKLYKWFWKTFIERISPYFTQEFILHSTMYRRNKRRRRWKKRHKLVLGWQSKWWYFEWEVEVGEFLGTPSSFQQFDYWVYASMCMNLSA